MNENEFMIVFTAVIAAATVATFLVYLRIASLLRSNNLILDRTNEISENMIKETQRNQEMQFAPLIFMELQKGKGVEPHMGEIEFKLLNEGSGSAIDIAITLENPHLETPNCVAVPALPAKKETECKIRHPSGHRPGVLDEFKEDSQLTILYGDLFGNRFETKYEKGRVAIRALGKKG